MEEFKIKFIKSTIQTVIMLPTFLFIAYQKGGPELLKKVVPVFGGIFIGIWLVFNFVNYLIIKKRLSKMSDDDIQKT